GVSAEPKEKTSLHPVLPVENPPGADDRVNPQTKTDRSQETKLVGTSPNDASSCTGPPEGSRNEEPIIASIEVAVLEAHRETDVGSSEEVKDNLLAGSPNPGTSKAAEFKADVKSQEPANPGSEVRNQPRLRTDEQDGESMDLTCVDLMLSKSSDVDLEVQDMDLDSEDEEDPVTSGVEGREETDGMRDDDMSSRHGPLPSKASSPDALSGHWTEFSGVQEAAVGPSSSSVSPNKMELIDKVPQQQISFHPVTVEEKMVGSASSSVSPNQMELIDNVPQQQISFHPVTIEEKMVGSTSSSVSPNQTELMDKVPQQENSFHPMTVEEKMVGSTSSSVSPNQMQLIDKVPQQQISFHPVTVEEKMVGSISSSVSPNQMQLMDKIPQQEISFHPMTVEEKMVGSTSSSVSPNQTELMDKVPQQQISFHPMTVEEKMVGSTSSSVSPNQTELMDKVPQQEISFHPMTVEEKMVGSTSSSVSPNQTELMDKVPQQQISFHPMTVEEKMVGSTSSSVSPNQTELMDKVRQQEISFHPVTVEEKVVGSTSSSVSPNQTELMDKVPQQQISFHPVTVEEKMVGSTSSSISPNQTELLDKVPQQEISFHPVTVDEKIVGSTSSSVSPNQMQLMDKVPQQQISFHPVTVEEKMVGSTSSSVSPNQMQLMDTVPQQEISFHPVTVEEKMVGSTSSSVSPNQTELLDKVPQQEISFHPVTVEEKMVGSTSSSVSPNQMQLMDKVPQQEISFHPMTVEEKMVGSTSSSVSPNQMELMDKVPQQEISFHPMTVEEKMVGSTSSSVSPNQMQLMDMVPQQEILFHPMTVEEKMVGSSSSSVSPNQTELMDKVPQQQISFHPVTVDEKMGSTSSSVSPNQMELMDKVPQQEISFHPVTVDEKMVGSTSSSVSPNQMELMDKVPQQQILFHPVTVEEKMVGSTSRSVSPNLMQLMDNVPQQEISFHPVTVDEKMVGSATDPTSPKQTDAVENSPDEVILADSASTKASGDFPNNQATTPDGSLQSPQEPVESPRVPNQIDVVDLSSVSQEGSGIRLPCLPSWQASPVHQRASDEEPPRIQEDRPENPLYHIFGNPLGLIEDISQDSTDLAGPAVLHLCAPNDNLCVNLVPNSISTQQELVENQDSSVVFAQCFPLAKEMDLVESPEGDHPASPLHQETSNEAATSQDVSSANLDLLEASSIPQEKDVIHPTDNVLRRVNERPAKSDLGTQEEQKIGQGEKIPVDSQPAKEFLSLELHDMESETFFKSETCLEQENIRDSSAREEEAAPDDGVEKPTITTIAVAEEVHILMNELVDTVCAMVAQSEVMRAPKSLDWIDSDMLEYVTPPVSDGEGCPTDQHSPVDVKWAEECLEETSSFDDQEEDLQARVEGRGELCSSSNENTTSDPGDVSEKAGSDATSAATGIISSCGTSQAELDTTSPKSRCSWLETTESPDDYSAKVDDYYVSTLEKVGQTEASPEESVCNREDCSRGEGVQNSSFVPAKCQEDSLAEEPGSLVDRDSNEAPEDHEEEAQEEAKWCLGSLEGPLPDERTERPTSSSGMDTDWEDESLAVDSSQDPCVDWYPTRKLESLHRPRFKASSRIESELTRSSIPRNETCKDEDWVSSEAGQKASDARSMKHNVPFGFKRDGSISLSRDMDRKPKPFKDYINFSITKKHKEKSRTFHVFSKEHNPFSRDLGSINSWSRNWGFLSDPVQNILDVESLQFHCRIQELLKRSQRSTSHVLPTKMVPPQRIAEGLLPHEKMVSERTIARFPSRSKSPLLVTVVNPSPRTGGRYHDIYGPFPASPDPFVPSAAPRSQGRLGPKYPFPSLHLQKLTYRKLNSFSRGLSSVLEEFAEFSRAMSLERARTCSPERDPTATSGKAGEIRYPPRPPTPLVYEDLLADLRNTLHFQLKNVAQEACRKPFSFYLMETEDDPLFGRIKVTRINRLLPSCNPPGIATPNPICLSVLDVPGRHRTLVPFTLIKPLRHQFEVKQMGLPRLA
ncbi:hypothetical protein E2320_004483, partial [Naja naja]